MIVRRSWVNLRRKSRTLCIALIICFLFFYSFYWSKFSTNIPTHAQSTLYCPQNPVAEDVLVVLRTGATEVLEKLPVHFDTTLRCVPNYVIFSDYEEEIEGRHIHDVFDELSQDLKESWPVGSLDNPGWKLDKFKFLPMIDKALRHRPQAKWFIFIEMDTYLSKFDSELPYYIGKQMYIGEVLFAHGGSGFALSAAAMLKATNHWKTHMADYNQYTIEKWAGDMVLGKVLKDIQIPLLWAFPHFQGDPVSTLDHNITKIDRQPWCYPAITYHHMPKDEIRIFWEFEQKWQRMHQQNVPLRHADVFKGHILPYLGRKKMDWDNYSACRLACEGNTTCLQFSHCTSSCSVSSELRLGRAVTSG
ncbi:hypothetical protein GQ44DRAFT_743687 [Phaeosphaeriaceae sp. PMI808]|nr:hypothetical protein GQ44DRAFT_743687 [Phaeosphaeriaceae sp. PMI808]